MRPAIPVAEISPPGVTSPCSCVSRSSSPPGTPAWARAVRAEGSTCTLHGRQVDHQAAVVAHTAPRATWCPAASGSSPTGRSPRAAATTRRRQAVPAPTGRSPRPQSGRSAQFHTWLPVLLVITGVTTVDHLPRSEDRSRSARARLACRCLLARAWASTSPGARTRAGRPSTPGRSGHPCTAARSGPVRPARCRVEDAKSPHRQPSAGQVSATAGDGLGPWAAPSAGRWSA